MKKIYARILLVWFFLLLLAGSLAFFEQTDSPMVKANVISTPSGFSCPEIPTEVPTEVPVLPSQSPDTPTEEIILVETEVSVVETEVIEPSATSEIKETAIPRTDITEIPPDATRTLRPYPTNTPRAKKDDSEEEDNGVVFYSYITTPVPTSIPCNLCEQEKRQADSLEKIALLLEKLFGDK